MIFLDTKPKGVPFTNIRFSCGRAFGADCGNFPNDSPQAPIPFQNPVPLISATQSCHIHPITKHQIIDLDVFPWSLDPETSPVESIVLEDFSIFFREKVKKISDRTTLPRETPKDRSRKHPGKVTKQKSETRLRFRRALSLNFKRRFEKATLL